MPQQQVTPARRRRGSCHSLNGCSCLVTLSCAAVLCPRPVNCATAVSVSASTAVVVHLAADAAFLYLRRIKDLATPEEQGQRPACVDMRVRVSFACTAPSPASWTVVYRSCHGCQTMVSWTVCSTQRKGAQLVANLGTAQPAQQPKVGCVLPAGAPATGQCVLCMFAITGAGH
jgi:hypothetical protein